MFGRPKMNAEKLAYQSAFMFSEKTCVGTFSPFLNRDFTITVKLDESGVYTVNNKPVGDRAAVLHEYIRLVKEHNPKVIWD